VLGFCVSVYEGYSASRNARTAEQNAQRAEENAQKASENYSRAKENELRAEAEALETQRQLDRANQALAAGILADLDLKHQEPLTPRQRNALWKLATADEAVRADFISVLSSSPDDMARIAAGFRQVSRSLGLQWPSRGDAEKLLATAVVAVKFAPKNVGDALQALVANLTEAQAQQALDPLLQQIGKTTDANALLALAEALKAVAAKLSDAQAQQALDPLLQQIGKTTDADALQALAEALKAVAAKLSDAQAQQALDPLLQQIGKTTDADALQALADALLALPTKKLTEAQAQKAFAVAKSSLAWAAREWEAVDWARALVALLPSVADQADEGETRKLVSALVYPPAAGATKVLLDALHARHSDAPATEAGTAPSMAWIAEKYPNEVRRPICPPPPQPTSLSGLKCPLEY
jgi:hypothetical protein